MNPLDRIRREHEEYGKLIDEQKRHLENIHAANEHINDRIRALQAVPPAQFAGEDIPWETGGMNIAPSHEYAVVPDVVEGIYGARREPDGWWALRLRDGSWRRARPDEAEWLAQHGSIGVGRELMIGGKQTGIMVEQVPQVMMPDGRITDGPDCRCSVCMSFRERVGIPAPAAKPDEGGWLNMIAPDGTALTVWREPGADMPCISCGLARLPGDEAPSCHWCQVLQDVRHKNAVARYDRAVKRRMVPVNRVMHAAALVAWISLVVLIASGIIEPGMIFPLTVAAVLWFGSRRDRHRDRGVR